MQQASAKGQCDRLIAVSKLPGHQHVAGDRLPQPRGVTTMRKPHAIILASLLLAGCMTPQQRAAQQQQRAAQLKQYLINTCQQEGFEYGTPLFIECVKIVGEYELQRQADARRREGLAMLQLSTMLGSPGYSGSPAPAGPSMPAPPANCQFIDSSTYCNGGLSAQTIGNHTYWSDGTRCQQIGNQLRCY